MRGQFRQGKRESAKACLNGRSIQTGQAGKCQSVSEWEVYSERASGKGLKRVGMGGLFRQGKRESAKACLNGRSIQTGQAGKCQSVSEWEVYSDRASGKVPKHVRMRGQFRQGKHKVPGYSQNTKFILNGCKLIEL